jgi:hypothetical protein
LNLKDVNTVLEHRICGGIEFLWSCYPNARHLDYEGDFGTATVVYNTITQEIYEADVSAKAEEWDEEPKPYRWLNPDYKDAMIAEATTRAIPWQNAWDDVKWVDLETEEHWFEKAKAILNGVKFDERIQVPVDLDNDTLLKLSMEAHKRDITLNDMIALILNRLIEEQYTK